VRRVLILNNHPATSDSTPGGMSAMAHPTMASTTAFSAVTTATAYQGHPAQSLQRGLDDRARLTCMVNAHTDI